MTKQKLKFKVDGGLAKLSELYTAADKDEGAADAYWQNPGALLEALNVAPSKEIRISPGYKKLADSMDAIDFAKWNDTFDHSRDDGMSVQENAFTSLWHSVDGADRATLEAGRLGDDFGQAYTITMTMTMTMTITITVTMTMTVTITSGYSRDENQRKLPVPGGPSFATADVARMTRYAQTLADHVGWFS